MATGSVFLSHLPRSKPISMLSLLSLHTDSPVLKWYATYLEEGAEGLVLTRRSNSSPRFSRFPNLNMVCETML